MKDKTHEEFKRFDSVMGGLLAVPYAELQKKLEQEKKEKAKHKKSANGKPAKTKPKKR